MIAGAALVAGGITGDAHSRATAKSDRSETVTQIQARNERALPGARSARQERVRAEPTLDELQRIRILNREQAGQLGRLQTENAINSGTIRHHYGRSHEAKEAFETDFLRHHQDGVLREALMGRTEALTRAAQVALAQGHNEDFVALSELVHPWDGVEAAVSLHQEGRAIEIFRRMHNMGLLIAKGAGGNESEAQTVRALVDHMSRSERHELRREIDSELALMRFQRDRMRERMTTAGESQNEIQHEMEMRQGEIGKVEAFAQQARR